MYLDPDLKFQTDRIKGCFEVWWLFHFVSPLLPASFLLVSIFLFFFCLLAVLSPSVCLSGGVFRVDASFVFGPGISATSYWCYLYTGGIQRSVCFISIDLEQDITSSVFWSQRVKSPDGHWKRDNKSLSLSLFACFSTCFPLTCLVVLTLIDHS